MLWYRPDPNTLFEETAHGLDLIVKQGKALCVCVFSYNPEQTKQISQI